MNHKYELETLKNKLKTFSGLLLKNLNVNTTTVSDICDKIKSDNLQISRLEMVIKPDMNLSLNVHPVSKIVYVIAKSYWLDDNGKKVRSFSKSIGRIDSFKNGICAKNGDYHKDVIKLAKEKITETMYKKYKEIYHENN